MSESLRNYVEHQGGAISVVEATSWLVVHGGYRDLTPRTVAELADNAGAPRLGRSIAVTPDVAEAIAEALEDDEDADDEDDGDEEDEEDDES